MNETLIVVPTYNERENLPLLVTRLLSLPVPADLLIVDGNSPDGTGKIADDLATKHPEVHVLHETEKRGLGRAYIGSFKWALQHGYEFIFEMDSDFSHNPDDLAKLRQAGAIILGKTNLDQFATGLVGARSPYGACRNSVNSDYISGGSSSGSAVAGLEGQAGRTLL